MSRTVLSGMNGSNPLSFLAAVGLLRLLDRDHGRRARLGFLEDGTFRAWIETDADIDLGRVVASDAASAANPQPWRLEYEDKKEKGNAAGKKVADLKPPPQAFRRFLADCVADWVAGRSEGAEYASAYATDLAVDGNGNTKPTALHFAAGQQRFLETLEEIRASIDDDWAGQSLLAPLQTRPGSNLRWDPDAERNRALLGFDPSQTKTLVNAPLEWLAFRALPALPCVPVGSAVVTTGVTGRRQNEIRFHWPLWSRGADATTVRSLLALAACWSSSLDPREAERRRERGIFAVCSCAIRRTAQGYGNFAPAAIEA